MPVQDLKEKLKWCIEKAFKGGTNQWIRVTGSARFDAGKRTRKEDLYSKEDIFKMLDFIIDGSYLAVGNFVFRQQVGIPMGTDPAPFMANLYLYSYEFSWMEKLTLTDYGIARRYYGRTKRFIDDLCTLNNGKQIEKHWKEIYPKELVLNKENINNEEASFLDRSGNQDYRQDVYYEDIRQKRCIYI